jgi:hypothetical protein
MHTETITGIDGGGLTVTIAENSCQSASDPSTFNCAGTYIVGNATGRFAGFAGATGKWSGAVTFSGFTVGSTGTFHSAYTN